MFSSLNVNVEMPLYLLSIQLSPNPICKLAEDCNFLKIQEQRNAFGRNVFFYPYSNQNV